jgi:hypothetical protein
MRPNIVLTWLTLLHCNWEVSVSNLCPETGHSDTGFTSFSAVTPIVTPIVTPLQLGHNCFLLNPFQFVIHLLDFHLTVYSKLSQSFYPGGTLEIIFRNPCIKIIIYTAHAGLESWKCSCGIRCVDHMSTQYRFMQSGKTASGGCSAGPRFVRAVAPRILYSWRYCSVISKL